LKPIKKETVAATITKAGAPEGQGPAPTGQWIRVVAFCRNPGHCIPRDEFDETVDPTANANDLISALTPSHTAFWLLLNDPQLEAKTEALRQQWRSAHKLP